MDQPRLPLAGSCRCGQLRIEISQPPLVTAACHCRGCQRMTGSAYALTAMIPAGGFKVTAGVPVKGGIHGPQLDHYCCPNCMSWVFTRIADYKEFVNVRPTMLDDSTWTQPFIETMTAHKLAWVTTPAKHSFEEFPVPQDFPRLMEEFAATFLA